MLMHAETTFSRLHALRILARAMRSRAEDESDVTMDDIADAAARSAAWLTLSLIERNPEMYPVAIDDIVRHP
jgi:hypothetical protein